MEDKSNVISLFNKAPPPEEKGPSAYTLFREHIKEVIENESGVDLELGLFVARDKEGNRYYACVGSDHTSLIGELELSKQYFISEVFSSDDGVES